MLLLACLCTRMLRLATAGASGYPRERQPELKVIGQVRDILNNGERHSMQIGIRKAFPQFPSYSNTLAIAFPTSSTNLSLLQGKLRVKVHRCPTLLGNAPPPQLALVSPVKDAIGIQSRKRKAIDIVKIMVVKNIK